MPSFAEITEFIKAVGVPAATLFLVIWRLEGRLADLVKAVQAQGACATQEHVEAATDKVIREIDHSTRNVLSRLGDHRP